MSKRSYTSEQDNHNNIVVIPSTSVEAELPNKKKKVFSFQQSKHTQQNNIIVINTSNIMSMASSGDVKTIATNEIKKNQEVSKNSVSLENDFGNKHLGCSDKLENDFKPVGTVQVCNNSGPIQIDKQPNKQIINVSEINKSVNYKISSDIKHEKQIKEDNIDSVKNISKINESGDIKYEELTMKQENLIKDIISFKKSVNHMTKDVKNIPNGSSTTGDKQFNSQDNLNIYNVDKSKKSKKHITNRKSSSTKKIVMKIELYINSGNKKPHFKMVSSSDTDDYDETAESDEVLQNSYSRFFDDFDVDAIVNSLDDSNVNEDGKNITREKNDSRISDIKNSKLNDKLHCTAKQRMEFDQTERIVNERNKESKRKEVKKYNDNIIVVEDSSSERESVIFETDSGKLINNDKIKVAQKKEPWDLDFSNLRQKLKNSRLENNVHKSKDQFQESGRSDNSEICETTMHKLKQDGDERNTKDDMKVKYIHTQNNNKSPIKSIVKVPRHVKNKMEDCDANYLKITPKEEDDHYKRIRIKTEDQFEDDQITHGKAKFVYNKSLDSSNECLGRIEKFSPEEELFAVELESRLHYMLKKNYSVTALVHDGKFSKVYKCIDSKGKAYAVKCLHPDRELFNTGIKTESMLRDLQKSNTMGDNYNCIHFVEGFSVLESWCYLMEYYHMNLPQALRKNNSPFHIDRVQDLARQLVSAVEMLHNKKIVHSDINPTHILINRTQDRIKLCGFDNAYYINNTKIHPNIGTVCYRPPEIILGFSATFSIDVWTTALVIYEMATNQKLFQSYFNNNVLYKQICMFGKIPRRILDMSLYKESYFDGNTFMRKFARGDPVPVYSFPQCDTISDKLLKSYNEYWLHRTKMDQLKDMDKLMLLKKLLLTMFVMSPKHRINIKGVKEHPFFQ